MVAASYRQQMAMQWSIVALMALLAIVSFLAAFYHRKGRDLILRSSESRRLGRSLQGDGVNVTNSNSSMRCNGLANLCDLSASDIVYATLHNGNAAVESGSIFVHNNVLDLEKAVQAGYRGVNIDIGKCFGKVRLVHTTCLISSRDITTVLQHLLDFLDANPHEVLLIPAEIAIQPLASEDVTLADMVEAFQSVPGWEEKLYNHPGPGHPWPTLRELIEADQRVLFFFYNGESCTPSVDCPYGFNPFFRYAADTQYSFNTVKELRDTATACQITRGGSSTRDFFGVNIFVTPARKLPALVVNQAGFLKEHVAACMAQNGGLQVNSIMVNYWAIGDLLAVVHELNAAL